MVSKENLQKRNLTRSGNLFWMHCKYKHKKKTNFQLISYKNFAEQCNWSIINNLTGNLQQFLSLQITSANNNASQLIRKERYEAVERKFLTCFSKSIKPNKYV